MTIFNFRYDKRIKPPVIGSLRVNISVVLLSLSSPDESSLVKLDIEVFVTITYFSPSFQHYEVEFIMRQRWDDPRLIHDDGGR